MKYLLLIVFFLFAGISKAFPLKIAVIDTGIKSEWKNRIKLCADGHKDFTGYGIEDKNGHGTNVAHLIDQYATGNYCIIVVKFFDERGQYDFMKAMLESIGHAIKSGASIINIMRIVTGKQI